MKKLLLNLEVIDGYPPVSMESVWAEVTAEGYFKINNIPFYSKEVSFGDIVSGIQTEENYLLYDKTIIHSQNSTLRIIFFNENQKFKDNGQDFFNYEPSQWDILVSNPPFSRKVEVFERCLKLGKPFALLMSNYWLNNVAPCRLFQNTDLELLMFDKRIQFGKGKNVPFNSSYFCHKILPKQIIFEQIDVTDKSPSCMQDDIPDKANINSQENKAIMNFQL